MKKISFLIFLVVAFVAIQSGESKAAKRAKNPTVPKVGKPMKDPQVSTNKQGKKLTKKLPKTDAKASDYGKEEMKGMKETNTYRGRSKFETGPAPKFPEAPTTSDVTAHESEVNGCRDHPLAQCSKCSRACYGPEHETYLFSFCRKSCGFCNEKTNTFHNFWRLRANSSFSPTWMLKEVRMYHEGDGNVNLAKNSSRAFASSEYSGFKASYAFDNNNDTYWYPDPYGPTHTPDSSDFIGFEFPVAVRIHGVHLLNDAKYPSAAPDNILVEASDDKSNGWDVKWAIHNSEHITDKRFAVHECPVLWKKYYDADNTAWCFRLFSQEKSFEEANDICEEEGAQLASVVSEEQKSFILKDVKICYKAWIGLHKEEKAYYWLDGSDSLYHNWKEEHYTESQRDDDKCVLMNEDGKWELEKCQDKNYFICKQKMYIRPEAKPEEVPNVMPYEPEIPPMIFYYPHVTEPVANTKHLPQGVFPDKTGKFPDGSDAEDDDEDTAVSAILYKLALKNLDEIKGQKAQTGTKPEGWQDPTNFTMKVDAIAKKLGNEMNKNNSDIKPSNPLDVVALPQLKEIETPKLDMSKVPGVPKWSHEDSTNNDNGKQTGVTSPVMQGKPVSNQQPKDDDDSDENDDQKDKANKQTTGQATQSTGQKIQAQNLPASIANSQNNQNNQKNPSANPPNPVQPTKDQANKQQDKNPPSGATQGPVGNVKPPPTEEQGSNPGASVGEAGEEGKEQNEKEDDDEDEEEDKNDEDEGTIVPNKPPQNKDQNQKNAQLAGQQNTNYQNRLVKNPLSRLHIGRSRVASTADAAENGSGSGDAETKEINDILDSMNKE